MNYLEKYIEHCSGFYSLLAWIESQSENGKPYSTLNNIIYFEPIISKYFSFGVVKGTKKSKEPFLAVQPIESEWFSLIKWKNLVLRDNDPYLYFISEPVKGDQETFPDIPSFAIALYIDTREKKSIIENLKTLSGREYFLDFDKQIRINFHKKIFNLKIENFAENTPLVSEEALFDYSEIILKQETKMVGYSDKPEFKGDVAKIDDTGLMKKWKENNI